MAAVTTRELHPEKGKTQPFPLWRIEDDAVIDEMLHTLREEENPAHE